MRIACISDTHALHRKIVVPDADVLVHAGDITFNEEKREIEDFVDWMLTLPHRRKVCIAGNHDRLLELVPELSAHFFKGVDYLNMSGVDIDGFKFFGSPYSPEFMQWAFMTDSERAEEIARSIPQNTDVLVSHSPPYGYGDTTREGYNVGCPALLDRIEIIRPKLVVCGHIHEAQGQFVTEAGVRVVNAVSLDLDYEVRPVPAIVVDL